MVHGSAVSLFRRRYKGLMRPMTLKSRVRASGKSSSSKGGSEGLDGLGMGSTRQGQVNVKEKLFIIVTG